MRALIVLTLLVAVAAGATDVYRWVDANGQVHYSDQWQPGAERIRIATEAPTPRTSPPAAPSAGAAGPGGGTTTKPKPGYESLNIVRPAQEEVLWNIGGQLPVSVQVTPGLKAGDSLRLYLDGKLQDTPAGATDAKLPEVYRGVHTLKAVVTSEAGAVLIESPTVKFVVRQTSILNPARPTNP